MKKMKWLAVIACIAALCMVLTSCGGASAEDRAKFVGTWNLVSTDAGDGSDSLTADNIATLNAHGKYTTLAVKDDGTLTYQDFDDTTYDGTWKASNASSGTAKLNNESMDLRITNDGLTLSQGKAVLTFQKKDQ